MTSALSPGQRIRLARENLCVAMAFYAAAHRGLIRAAFVPASTEVHLTEGQVVDASVPLEMSDQQGLIRCAGNQVRAAFAVCALQTQRELDGVSAEEPLEEPDPNVRAARAVCFVIGHSLERELLNPTWVVPVEYRQDFDCPALGLTFDVSGWNGREIRWGHLGGLTTYLDLILFASYCVDGIPVPDAASIAKGDYTALADMAPAGSHVEVGEGPAIAGYGSGSGRLRRPGPAASGPEPGSGWIAPDGFPQPAVTVASQASECGPIDDFVTDACSTDAEAMSLASDLYTSYASWCLEQGYLAHSQRKFGLELRARGYLRKRRGKGKHWWLGVRAQQD